jgi:RNA polymerase sigma-70 factor (ECF subfamily)
MFAESKYKNEKTLIIQLEKGSEEAFAFFFKAYHKPLCNYIAAVSGNAKISEEIAQQAFVKFWNKRENICIREECLKSYLFKIAYNLFIDSKRKKKKELGLLETLKNEAYLDIIEIDHTLFEERLKRVEAEIENLPEQCKRVFIMSKKQGLEYREIAHELHISIKTVEAHMSKALKKLRYQLSMFL